jgi:hypothetical protein
MSVQTPQQRLEAELRRCLDLLITYYRRDPIPSRIGFD